jgi:TPR repeat protein
MLNKICVSGFILTIFIAFPVHANYNLDQAVAADSKGEYSEAVNWYSKAADQGDTSAQYRLGRMYHSGIGVKKNEKMSIDFYQKAFNRYHKAADQGDASAQYRLGTMYGDGKGVKKDIKMSLDWYHKAADQGNTSALTELGGMYHYGNGVKKDEKMSADWYHKAVVLLRKAAVQGDASAQFSLGMMYLYGTGIERDRKLGADWNLKAANQGHIKAQNILGWQYSYGKGVELDIKNAAYWYTKAAEQGDHESLRILADFYENGIGVQQDWETALSLYKQSGRFSTNGYNSLKEKMDCHNNNAVIKLFNQPLKCVKRKELLVAVKKAGAIVIREDPKFFGDKYDSSKILKGTSNLELVYTMADEFAQAYYTFPSKLDIQQVTKVVEFVSEKYGKPDSSEGHAEVGAVVYTWNLEDGIVLKVSRGWPDTTTSLAFIHTKNLKTVMDYIEREKKRIEARKYRLQDNAF